MVAAGKVPRWKICIRFRNITKCMKISFDDCRAQLLDKSGKAGHGAYAEWRARANGRDVVRFVESFTHETLLRLTPADMKSVMSESDHALGDVRSEEQLRFIENFTCPFALQHIFHYFIESQRHVPTWQEFDLFVRKTAQEFWMEPMRSFLRSSCAAHQVKSNSPIGWEAVNRAIRWRLGKFYYSAMREIDLFVRVRSAGLDIKYHIFADVLLRVDFWRGMDLICVYFRNGNYRDGAEGRKKPTSSFFNDEAYPFKVHHVDIFRQGAGRFWLATEDSIEGLVNVLS